MSAAVELYALSLGTPLTSVSAKMKKSKCSDQENKRFLAGVRRVHKEFHEWEKRQSPIISRFLEVAVRALKRGRLKEAKCAALNAAQAFHEIENVWVYSGSPEYNKLIKTVPKMWEKPLAQKR